jgi:hypothetical protein
LTKANVALKQYLSNVGHDGDIDFQQESMQVLTQMLIELEGEEKLVQKSMNARLP